MFCRFFGGHCYYLCILIMLCLALHIQPLVASPNEVELKGVKEAIQLMKEGSTWELYIPPELGYGEKGLEGFIHEGAVLIYELELIKVEVLDSKAEL